MLLCVFYGTLRYTYKIGNIKTGSAICRLTAHYLLSQHSNEGSLIINLVSQTEEKSAVENTMRCNLTIHLQLVTGFAYSPQTFHFNIATIYHTCRIAWHSAYTVASHMAVAYHSHQWIH